MKWFYRLNILMIMPIIQAILAIGVCAKQPTEVEKSFIYPEFSQCGLVTQYSPIKIPPSCLKEALNIYYDENLSISRRKGYAKYNATPCQDQKAIRGLWAFNATDGRQYLVINSSQSFFYSTGIGDCTAIDGLSGFNTENDFSCVQALGKLWCSNGIDTPFYWDGTSTSTVADFPLAELVSTFANRIVAADIAGKKTRILLSGEGDGTDWDLKVPGKSTTPASIDISGLNDGNNVTCLMGEYQGAFFIGREYDLWALYGSDRRNFKLRKISGEVGCIDNNSVQFKDNCLIWLSNRGIEKLCGTKITRVSDPIKENIDELIKSAGNKRTKTYNTQAEWEAGLSNGEWTSTTIYPGSIVPSTWGITITESYQFDDGTLVKVTTEIVNGALTLDYSGSLVLYDDFSDGNYTDNPTWVCSGDCSYARASSGYLEVYRNDDVSASANFYSQDDSRGFGKWKFYIYTYENTKVRYYFISNKSDYSSTNGYCLESSVGTYPADEVVKLYRVDNGSLVEIGSATSGSKDAIWFRVEREENGDFSVYFDDESSPSITASDDTYSQNTYRNIYIYDGYATGSAPHVYIDNIYNTGIYYDSGYYMSEALDTSLDKTVIGAFSSNFSTSSSKGTDLSFAVRQSNDGSSWDNWVDLATQEEIQSFDFTKRYWQFVSSFTTTYSTTTPILYDYSLKAMSTGYFITDCVDASGITSWGNFRPSQYIDGNSSISYYISTGTTCNEVTRSTANWVSQIANTSISVSTSPYLGAKFVLNPTAATETVRVDALTVEWNEGANRPPVASGLYDDRYWLFYTTNTVGDPYNDHALILDKNDRWTLFDDIYARSAAIYRNEFYTGDSKDTGYIYKQNIGLDDAGNDFDFSFKTSDYDFGNPLERKLLKRIYLLLKSEELPNQNIDLTLNYYIDGSTTAYSLSSVDLSEALEEGYFVAEFPVPNNQAATFHWLSLGISYTGDQGPVEVYGIRVVYSIKGWE